MNRKVVANIALSLDGRINGPGGGARLFDDGLPSSGWTLAEATSHDTGAINLLYDRNRTTP